jgi:hypothetical protein
MNFDQYQTEDRRLVLLKGLAAAAQYRANGYLLRRFADQVGHTASADRISADLAWLAEAGLITTEATAPDVTVATLTARGLDVADGRAVHPGVAKPRPTA